MNRLDASAEINRLAGLCEKLARDVAERDALIKEKDAVLQGVVDRFCSVGCFYPREGELHGFRTPKPITRIRH